MAQYVYVCSAHQNIVLLVDAMDWGLTYKDLIKKIVYNPESNKRVIDDVIDDLLMIWLMLLMIQQDIPILQS